MKFDHMFHDSPDKVFTTVIMVFIQLDHDDEPHKEILL